MGRMLPRPLLLLLPVGLLVLMLAAVGPWPRRRGPLATASGTTVRCATNTSCLSYVYNCVPPLAAA